MALISKSCKHPKHKTQTGHPEPAPMVVIIAFGIVFEVPIGRDPNTRFPPTRCTYMSMCWFPCFPRPGRAIHVPPYRFVLPTPSHHNPRYYIPHLTPVLPNPTWRCFRKPSADPRFLLPFPIHVLALASAPHSRDVSSHTSG